ncbi:MAG: carbon-nitrogen hydrolase family protein [Candidatus Thermoplasmatota archaeon]
MKNVKIALISARPKIADKQENIQKIKTAIQKTKADIYIFGEMFLTGYPCKDDFRDLAEEITGPSITELVKTAKKNNCYIIFGMPLRDHTVTGLIYNSAILIHPNGTVDHYNKWFLPNFGPFEERIFFDQGEEISTFQTRFGTIGLLICYDIYFPELARALVLQGAEMLIYISAAPNVTRKFFETLLPARALENTVYTIYVNLAGNQDDLVYWGGSQLYDPLGNQLIRSTYFEESICTIEIDLSLLTTIRGIRPLLRDIRPEIYQDIYHITRFHRNPEKEKNIKNHKKEK